MDTRCPRGASCERIESTRLTCEVMDRLLATFESNGVDSANSTSGAVPSTTRVIEALHCLQDVLFPGRMSTELRGDEVLEAFVTERLARAHSLLRTELAVAIPYRWRGHYAVVSGKGPEPEDVAPVAEDAIVQLYHSMPEIRERLVKDVEAAYVGDPAATTFAEVVLAYPCIRAITTHRIAHELYCMSIPLIPRIMSEHAHSHTGIDIHPGARIGESFFIDHGTGVVIGETCEIGANVKIYQGVTLGAKSFPRDADGHPIKGIKRHPTIEENVIIYAGATILGGDTTIGHDSIIGANTWLAESVAPYSSVVLGDVDIKIRNRSGG